jgi:hypothetical protein
MGKKHTAQTKLRGAYGKPIARMAGENIELTYEQVQTCAEIILESIKKEIRRDIALSAAIRGPTDPVILPHTQRFPDSFTYRIKGKSTIEITSDWPTASAHTNKLRPGFVDNTRPDGSAPIEMRWLMAPTVPLARIVQKDGQVVVRTTPLSRNQDGPWIHPGYRKYTFLERGLRKGRKAAAEAIVAEVLAEALHKHSLFPG